MENSNTEVELATGGKFTSASDDECDREPQKQPFVASKKTKGIGYSDQILLTLVFFASQLSVEFYSIYGVLSLQYFGLPTYLISSPSLVSGILSLTIIPVTGAFSDRGSRPKFRKAVMQALGLGILLMGYTLIASGAAITSKEVIGDAKGDNNYLSGQLNQSSGSNHTSLQSEQRDVTPLSSSSPSITSIGTNANIITENTLRGGNSTTLPSRASSGVTVAGVLGIIGMSSIDISNDMTMALSKGLIVESVPTRQKTQILTRSTILSGLGGCTMSCIGMLDLPHHLGKHFNTDGMALAIILFCSFFSLISILLFGMSMRTALQLYYKSIRIELGGSSEALSLDGNGVKAKESIISVHHTTTDYDTDRIVDIRINHDNIMLDKGQRSFENLSKFDHAGQPTTTKQKNNIHRSDELLENDSKTRSMVFSDYLRNKRFVLTIFSSFLGMGIILAGGLYSSHTLTIEVYEGDPTASPGTRARDDYEEGIKMASVGFLVSNVVFVLTSITNTKLLKHIDHCLLFAFSSVVLGLSALAFYLLKTVPAFLVVMGTFGSFRCMGYVIPYTNAIKYAYPSDKQSPRTDNSSDETARAPAGKITALVGTTLPLHFLLLTFMGPAMELVGNSWLPMLYIIGLTGLNVVINVILKIL